jgi:hypothetical protein
MEAFTQIKRKTWEVKQCLKGLESLQTIPNRVVYEAVRVKPKLQWIIQDVRNVRSMGYHLRKTANNMNGANPRERVYVDRKWQSHRGRVAQVHWSIYPDTICPERWT